MPRSERRTRDRSPLHLVRIVGLALALAAAGLVFAQDGREVGTIEGALDGEAETWYLLEFDTDEGTQSTATVNEIMSGFYTLSLQAHPEPRYAVEGTLSLSASLFGLPENCPCEIGDAEALLFSTSSMFGDLYTSAEPGSLRLVLDVFEPVGDDAFRVEGSFEAELAYIEGLGSQPDGSDMRGIEGTFRVDRVALEDAGLDLD